MSHILQLNEVLAMKVVCYDTVAFQLGLNVLHYRVSSIAGAPAITDLAMVQALDAIFAPAYKPWMHNNAQYRGIIGQVIKPTEFVVQSSNANAGVGTGGANAAPDQVTGLVSCRTGLAGRANRGRFYPGFVPVAVLTAAGFLTAGGLIILQALAAAIPLTKAITAGANTTTITLCIYHRATSTTTDINSLIAVNAFATQRRRGSLSRTNTIPI